MGSVKRQAGKLIVSMEIKKIMASNLVFYEDKKLTEGISFKAAVANLLLKLANDAVPSLEGKTGYEKSSIDLSEDEKSIVVIFE